MNATRREYLVVRFSFEDRGVTREFSLFDQNGARRKGWTNNRGQVTRASPEFLERIDKGNREFVTRAVHCWHVKHVKRSKEDGPVALG